MDSLLVHSLVKTQSAPDRRSFDSIAPLAPAQTLPERRLPNKDGIELQPLSQGFPPSITPAEAILQDDLERSSPPPEAVIVVPSFWDPARNKYRIMACCLAGVANALSDGAAGALIPYIEACVSLRCPVLSLCTDTL